MIPIASRNLTAPDGRAVTLSVFAPEAHERGWRCGVRVVLDGAQTLEYAEGIDAFQVLSLGLFEVWRQAGELGATAEGLRGGSWLLSHRARHRRR